MSYIHMDHAGWVERNNVAANRIYEKKKGYKPAPEKLSPVQVKAVTILGIALGGIYNARISWDKTEWDYGKGCSFIVRDGRCSTFDFSALTHLVLMAHEARMRLEIEARTRGYFRISFWQRSHEGGISQRHPNIDEAVASFRSTYGDDHPLFYRSDAMMEASK